MTTALLTALLLAAHPPTTCKEASPGLHAKAKVSCVTARREALKKVAGKHLRVVSAELEEESGRLVYSFDIAAGHRTGVEEVQVDATSGKVVSVKHETTKDEAAEQD